MELVLTNLSKKFVSNTLFKGLNAHFKSNGVYAITGPNGSGKSTLLQIISGYLAPSQGQITLVKNNSNISKEDYYTYFNICAPYLSLINEFTLAEHITFHEKFKKPIRNDLKSIFNEIEKANLSSSLHKPINEFSSGMRQRVKLIFAVCYESEILLLDEPTSHLDKSGKNWYLNLMKEKIHDRITLIFSNEQEEFSSFTNNIINIDQFK